MRTIHARNVNDAWSQGYELLKKEGVPQTSRNGDTLEVPGPVAVVYTHPWERVLYEPGRNANPFFHLFESLWMLAGRNDVAYLVPFAKQMAEYAEEDGLIHGAYGYRWKFSFLLDQLPVIVSQLRHNSSERRAVLAMWDPDLDLGADKRDLPCNTHAYFKIREGRLNMTVCNRSNDIIWGLFGANAVHFSFLQEYLAAQIGVEMGTYVQFTDSFHAYTEVLDRIPVPGEVIGLYPFGEGHAPLVRYTQHFDSELRGFLDEHLCIYCDHDRTVHGLMCTQNLVLYDNGRAIHTDSVCGCMNYTPAMQVEWSNSFLRLTARPMRTTWATYKVDGVEAARRCALKIQAPDWRFAALVWLAARK